MKNIILLGFFVGISAFGNSQQPPLPNGLLCRATACIFGEPVFCRPADFSRIAIKGIQSQHPKWDDTDGEVEIAKDNDKVTLNFGLDDADQYSFFTFRKDDIWAFQHGRLRALPGTYEDGYDWADGYHTRALLAVTCNR